MASGLMGMVGSIAGGYLEEGNKMAIGDTVQAGLGRMDFSAFQRAGEAQARANQAFGDAIGSVAKVI